MKKTLAIGLIAALALLSGACGSDSEPADSGPKEEPVVPEADAVESADLLDRTFTSTEVEGHELVADSQLTFTFTVDDLSVSAGCNQLGGAYELDASQLKWVDTPRATMMACDQPLMDQDTWITELLTEGVVAELEGDTLILSQGDVKITATEDVAQTAEVTGTTWTLESIVSGEAVGSIPAGAEPATLELDGDGTAAVFTGCNNGSAGVTVDEDAATMTFEPMALTKMACAGEGAIEVETAVTTVLDGEVTYAIEGDQLTITKGTEGLVFTAG